MSTSLYATIQFLYGDSPAFLAGLKSRMKLHHITQCSVADKAGIKRPHMTRWMQGQTTPDLESRLRLDEALESLIAGK